LTRIIPIILNPRNTSGETNLSFIVIEHFNFNPNVLARTLALGKQFSICSLLPKASSTRGYWSLHKKGVEKIANDYKDFGVEID